METSKSPGARGDASRLLLVGENTDQLRLVGASIAVTGMDEKLTEVERLPEQAAGASFDLAIVNAAALDAYWQQVVALIKSRLSIPVLCLVPIPDPDEAQALARMGADDIAFLPVRMDELEARVRLLVSRAGAGREQVYPFVERRRSHRGLASRPGKPTMEQLVVDDREKKVVIGSRTVHLSPKEYSLILLLASDPGRVFSVREIATHLWPKKQAQGADVQQYVHLLRRKVEEDPSNPRWVLTEPGFGYRLAVPG